MPVLKSIFHIKTFKSFEKSFSGITFRKYKGQLRLHIALKFYTLSGISALSANLGVFQGSAFFSIAPNVGFIEAHTLNSPYQRVQDSYAAYDI